MSRAARVIALAALVLAGTRGADAQVSVGTAEPRRGSVEISGSALWSGGFDVGSRAADLTRNTGTGTGPYTLFTTTSKVGPATGARARVGVHVSRAFAIEGGAQYSRPLLTTRASADLEGAEDADITDRIARFVFDGGVIAYVHRLTFAGGRAVPFVTGGAGYLRELHEGNEVVDTGTEAHAGGGLMLWLGRGARRFGIRADVGVSILIPRSDSAGSQTDSIGRKTFPTAAVGLAYLF